MSSLSVIANSIDNASKESNGMTDGPAFYYKLEDKLNDAFGDHRFKIDLNAATKNSGIFTYRGVKYYFYMKNNKAVVELFHL